MRRRWPTWRQKQATFRRLGYDPHEGQVLAHRCEGRVVLVAGAERAGKSEWVGKEIVARLPWCDKVAICAQEYDESRAEAGYVIEGLERLGALTNRSTPKVGKWVAVTRWGAEVETISLHDGPDELTGTGDPFDVVALVEAGLIRYDAFLAAVRRVSEMRGVVLVAGTLKDTFGWHADLFRSFEGPNVFAGERFSFPAWMNLAIFPGGRDDEEIKHLERVLPEDDFVRTVAAGLVPSPARIFPEFSYPVHVAEVPFDDSLPVYLVVDPGYYPSHYAVLALQVVEETFREASGSVYRMDVVRQIDEVWEHHLMHQDVIHLCEDRPWWNSVERAYGGHETRQHQAAESTQEIWEELTPFPFEVVDAGRILDGIVRVKTFLKDPVTGERRYVVDLNCTGTLHEFQAYQRRMDSRGNVVSEEPKDENNDAMDALRNFLVARFGLVERTRRLPRPGRRRLPARG